MSLIVSRRLNESIKIHGPSEVRVVKIRGNRIYLSVKAEREVLVLRGELEPRKTASTKQGGMEPIGSAC
jgi:carbon storage regulator CsrA